jgi:DNA transformation protein
LYGDGVFVAIIAGETLYLKADAQSRARFAQAGSHCFQYTARGERHSTDYWSAPADAMESPPLMAPWVRLALEAALRAKAPRRKR